MKEAVRNEGKQDPEAYRNLAMMYLGLADGQPIQGREEGEVGEGEKEGAGGKTFEREERVEMLKEAENWARQGADLVPEEKAAMEAVAEKCAARRLELESVPSGEPAAEGVGEGQGRDEEEGEGREQGSEPSTPRNEDRASDAGAGTDTVSVFS